MPFHIVLESPSATAYSPDMQDHTNIRRHVLPGEAATAGEDSSWFYRQNPFEQQELLHLVHYKRNVLGISEDGCFSKQPNFTYPHILPEGSLRQVFYEPMAGPVLDYLTSEGIQQHTELLNLKSSQACCLNLFFPLRLDRQLAADVMRPFCHDLDSVTGVEFEYTAQDEALGDSGCTQWLGEPPSGKRGQNRTSIDVTVFWTSKGEKRHASLIEFKYTERSFGVCSAFDKAKGDDKAGCMQDAYASQCLLTKGGPYRSRQYWKRLAGSGIDLAKVLAVSGCPFRGPFYQLMRQYLVARYMQETGLADHADVLVLHFRGNQSLKEVPKDLRPLATSDILDAWNKILTGAPPIRALEAESLMQAYDHAKGVDPGWRNFIRNKYRI